jgi:hypothetical protein
MPEPFSFSLGRTHYREKPVLCDHRRQDTSPKPLRDTSSTGGRVPSEKQLFNLLYQHQLHNRNKNGQHSTAKYQLNIGVYTLVVIASCHANFTGANRRPSTQAALLARFSKLASPSKKPRTMPGLFFLKLRGDQYPATSGPLNL